MTMLVGSRPSTNTTMEVRNYPLQSPSIKDLFLDKPFIQKAAVEDILDSVISELKQNKDRRFIYVETAFFWKWWMKQHDFIRHNVKNLVKNGQLEFVSGGWSMNDEATTNYQSIVDQMTWGLRFVCVCFERPPIKFYRNIESSTTLLVNAVCPGWAGKLIHSVTAEKWPPFSPSSVSMDSYWAELTMKTNSSGSKRKRRKWFGKAATI